MKIAFIDCSCVKPYDYNSLNSSAIAGTESTTIRVAHALASKHDVTVFQLNRQENLSIHGVAYLPLSKATDNFDRVILLRKYQFLEEIYQRFSRARLFFWAHDLAREKIQKYRHWFVKYDCTIVPVSHYLAASFDAILNQGFLNKFFRRKKIAIKPIYNLIDQSLENQCVQYDPYKLLFLSSPNKGLAQVVENFKALLTQDPNYTLYIANPGYIALENCKQMRGISLDSQQIVILGAMQHHQVIDEMRTACCVFYPQAYKAETFGLVFAEANAVGTPVMAHEFGAAPEVLNGADQLVDANNQAQVIDKMLAWTRGDRPVVSMKAEFKQTEIMAQWYKLLGCEE